MLFHRTKPKNMPVPDKHPRLIAVAVLATCALVAAAQAAPEPTAPAVKMDQTLYYILGGLAGVQAFIIMALSGILRTLGGMAGLGSKLAKHGGRAVSVLAFFALTVSANAQAYTPPSQGTTDQVLFWMLVALNTFLLTVILLQLHWIRAFTTLAFGEQQVAATEHAMEKRSWWAVLQAKLTRQVKIEEEKTIELDHDYDGIKELDNVLPPWWLWLFYGSIAWGVVYIINVHVIKVWPDSVGEYKLEMAQAKTDVDAYLATQTNTVDENTVTATDDAAVIAEGHTIFSNNCVACHGADASGAEFSVGPNLTDAYWLHGGGVKNIFHTIKFGVPEKGMISWKAQLQPAQIRAVACYILAQHGKGGPTQKAPQGELWKDDASAPADSTATAAAKPDAPTH